MISKNIIEINNDLKKIYERDEEILPSKKYSQYEFYHEDLPFILIIYVNKSDRSISNVSIINGNDAVGKEYSLELMNYLSNLQGTIFESTHSYEEKIPLKVNCQLFTSSNKVIKTTCIDDIKKALNRLGIELLSE